MGIRFAGDHAMKLWSSPDCSSNLAQFDFYVDRPASVSRRFRLIFLGSY